MHSLSTAPSPAHDLAECARVWRARAGANQYGQLGLGHRAQVREPQRVEGIPAVAAVADARTQLAAVAAGVWHSVAVTAAGDVWTWGRDSFGQLGHGARLDGAWVICSRPLCCPALPAAHAVPSDFAWSLSWTDLVHEHASSARESKRAVGGRSHVLRTQRASTHSPASKERHAGGLLAS